MGGVWNHEFQVPKIWTQLTDDHAKEIPPWGNKSIVLSMAVLNVTDVSELSGIVKAHLEISLQWDDFR
jgi:hypothetical protein